MRHARYAESFGRSKVLWRMSGQRGLGRDVYLCPVLLPYPRAAAMSTTRGGTQNLPASRDADRFHGLFEGWWWHDPRVFLLRLLGDIPWVRNPRICPCRSIPENIFPTCRTSVTARALSHIDADGAPKPAQQSSETAHRIGWDSPVWKIECFWLGCGGTFDCRRCPPGGAGLRRRKGRRRLLAEARDLRRGTRWAQ